MAAVLGSTLPRYRQWMAPMPGVANDMIYPVGMAPHQFKPQDLSQQGPMAMTSAGPVPQPTSPLTPAAHPPMGIPEGRVGAPGMVGERMPAPLSGPIADGRFFNVGGPSTPRAGGPPPAFANRGGQMGGNDLVAFGAEQQGGGRQPIPDGRFFNVGASMPNPAAPPPKQYDIVPFGASSSERGSRYSTPTAPGFNWTPNPITPPPMLGGGAQPRYRQPRPQLNNSAPDYDSRMAGTVNFETGGGWWRDPTYAVSNAGGWWHDPTGAGQDLNRQMAGLTPYGTPIGTGPGGAPRGGGGFLGGWRNGGQTSGGGAPSPFQAFIDAANAANAANAARANNLNAGYRAQYDYARQLLDGLGNQSRADTNTAYDNALSGGIQAAISSGMANGSLMTDTYRGNARDRSSAMNRVNEALLAQRLGVELPLIDKQLAFNERINQNAPDPNLLAQLAAQAGAAGMGAGPVYGAPMTIDSGSIPFQSPGFSFGFGMPGIVRSYGSQLVKNGGRPQYGSGMGGGFGGLMGGQMIPGFSGRYPTPRKNPMSALTPPGSGVDPDLILRGDSELFAPPGADFGGDWNLGGPRLDMPMFPWMYE